MKILVKPSVDVFRQSDWWGLVIVQLGWELVCALKNTVHKKISLQNYLFFFLFVFLNRKIPFVCNLSAFYIEKFI